jgi:predicted nucleotidyltransferase
MIKFERLPADILSKIPGAASVLLQDDNVVFAYLFGGIARGGLLPLADIDIAVYVKETSGLIEFKLSLFDRLAGVLGTAELALVIMNTAPVSLTGRILQNRETLVDKVPSLRHSYESLTLREFVDFKVKEDAFFRGRYGVG